MSAPLKMTGMSIERGNRRCLVAKPRRLPGDRVAVQVKSVDYYRQQIDLVTINSERQTNRRYTSQSIDHELSLTLNSILMR